MFRTPVRLRPLLASSLLLATAVAGCGVEKSENPLSPSVAGPIAGVEISTPRALEPGHGARVKNAQQPLRLTVANASTNGVRPLSYTFEVATDDTFQTKLFARSGVAPGEGQTSVVIDRLDQPRTYVWRAKAEDGANTGAFVTAAFEILPQPQLGAPTLVSPINDATVGSQQPQLVVGSSTRNAAIGAVSYEVQVALDVAFSQLVAAGIHPETGGQTVFHPANLPASRRHYWRARASDGETTSAWAATQSFITAAAPAPPPPSPGPSPQPPASCASNNGPAIVACISARYPERRAPVGSLGERQHNMEFLRDRIIEAGKCGGLDLGYNMKRGGPERSIDFLAWRRSDGEMGVDLGFDYDNIGTTLQLQWAEAGLGATWAPYPSVSCQ